MKLKSSQILIKPLKNKSVVWFTLSNTYVLVANQTAKLLTKITDGLTPKKLELWCNKTFGLSIEQSKILLKSVFELINKLNKPACNTNDNNGLDESKIIFKINKLYKIDNHKIKVSYQNEKLELLIHPKFAHLEIDDLKTFEHHFKVYLNKNYIVLSINHKIIGKWDKNEIHYFQGKFSMDLVERIYDIKEEDWMGVFHASALSDGKKSILFTGDSGNGKSTLAALLMHKGFDLLADDFVPISAANNNVYRFPAAISIKVKALKLLTPLFPELKTSAQFHYKNLNKTVRYLPPVKWLPDSKKQFICKAIVQIKYKKDSGIKFEKMRNEDAFKYLIPDSWLSPKTDNAQKFLNWFAAMPCYKLTYGNTALMYKTVKNLFNNA